MTAIGLTRSSVLPIGWIVGLARPRLLSPGVMAGVPLRVAIYKGADAGSLMVNEKRVDAATLDQR